MVERIEKIILTYRLETKNKVYSGEANNLEDFEKSLFKDFDIIQEW